MKQLFLYSITLLLSAGALAQSAGRQVIRSSGTGYAGTSIQVDCTIGEAVISSGISGSFSVNQGFQQNAANSTGLKETKALVCTPI